MLQTHQTRYKAVSIAMFAIAAGLALLRVLSYAIYLIFEETSLGAVASETLQDTIFTVLSQVVVCFLVPFLLYMFLQKRTAKQIFIDSNYNKLDWRILALSVPMGIGCLCITFLTSGIWMSLVIAFGYNYVPPEVAYPAGFNPALLILSIVLTGVLPAICEEFAMRGNFLTALRGTNKYKTVIILSAIAFGLFHQGITQVFYTALFGGFMAFITIKTNSIYPAVIMHFMNNTIGVIWNYGSEYGWRFFEGLDRFYAGGGVFLLFIAGAAIVALCTSVILKIAKQNNYEKPVEVIYRPTMRENAWLIGAMVIAIASTIFTFAFGVY